LTDADFSGANLTNADLSLSNLTRANLHGAVVSGTNFSDTTSRGFRKEQLYATASYTDNDLRAVVLSENDLSGWDLSEQDLRNANLEKAIAFNTDLRATNLKNANLRDSVSLESAALDSTATYNQWTVFPEGYDPIAAGLTFSESPIGDFNGDDSLDVEDIQLLNERIHCERVGLPCQFWLTEMFDLDGDGNLFRDRIVWVDELKHTYHGDANLDGEFNTTDLVLVFQAGKFETGKPAGWAEGDWDSSGDFSSHDLVWAFTSGGFEQGPRGAIASIPEPDLAVVLIIGLVGILHRTRAGPRADSSRRA
jgi:hypothetical protein